MLDGLNFMILDNVDFLTKKLVNTFYWSNKKYNKLLKRKYLDDIPFFCSIKKSLTVYVGKLYEVDYINSNPNKKAYVFFIGVATQNPYRKKSMTDLYELAEERSYISPSLTLSFSDYPEIVIMEKFLEKYFASYLKPECMDDYDEVTEIDNYDYIRNMKKLAKYAKNHPYIFGEESGASRFFNKKHNYE